MSDNLYTFKSPLVSSHITTPNNRLSNSYHNTPFEDVLDSKKVQYFQSNQPLKNVEKERSSSDTSSRNSCLLIWPPSLSLQGSSTPQVVELLIRKSLPENYKNGSRGIEDVPISSFISQEGSNGTFLNIKEANQQLLPSSLAWPHQLSLQVFDAFSGAFLGLFPLFESLSADSDSYLLKVLIQSRLFSKPTVLALRFFNDDSSLASSSSSKDAPSLTSIVTSSFLTYPHGSPFLSPLHSCPKFPIPSSPCVSSPLILKDHKHSPPPDNCDSPATSQSISFSIRQPSPTSATTPLLTYPSSTRFVSNSLRREHFADLQLNPSPPFQNSHDRDNGSSNTKHKSSSNKKRSDRYSDDQEDPTNNASLFTGTLSNMPPLPISQCPLAKPTLPPSTTPCLLSSKASSLPLPSSSRILSPRPLPSTSVSAPFPSSIQSIPKQSVELGVTFSKFRTQRTVRLNQKHDSDANDICRARRQVSNLSALLDVGGDIAETNATNAKAREEGSIVSTFSSIAQEKSEKRGELGEEITKRIGQVNLRNKSIDYGQDGIDGNDDNNYKEGSDDGYVNKTIEISSPNISSAKLHFKNDAVPQKTNLLSSAASNPQSSISTTSHLLKIRHDEDQKDRKQQDLGLKLTRSRLISKSMPDITHLKDYITVASSAIDLTAKQALSLKGLREWPEVQVVPINDVSLMNLEDKKIQTTELSTFLPSDSNLALCFSPIPDSSRFGGASFPITYPTCSFIPSSASPSSISSSSSSFSSSSSYPSTISSPSSPVSSVSYPFSSSHSPSSSTAPSTPSYFSSSSSQLPSSTSQPATSLSLPTSFSDYAPSVSLTTTSCSPLLLNNLLSTSNSLSNFTASNQPISSSNPMFSRNTNFTEIKNEEKSIINTKRDAILEGCSKSSSRSIKKDSTTMGRIGTFSDEKSFARKSKFKIRSRRLRDGLKEVKSFKYDDGGKEMENEEMNETEREEDEKTDENSGESIVTITNKSNIKSLTVRHYGDVNSGNKKSFKNKHLRKFINESTSSGSEEMSTTTSTIFESVNSSFSDPNLIHSLFCSSSDASAAPTLPTSELFFSLSSSSNSSDTTTSERNTTQILSSPSSSSMSYLLPSISTSSSPSISSLKETTLPQDLTPPDITNPPLSAYLSSHLLSRSSSLKSMPNFESFDPSSFFPSSEASLDPFLSSSIIPNEKSAASSSHSSFLEREIFSQILKEVVNKERKIILDGFTRIGKFPELLKAFSYENASQFGKENPPKETNIILVPVITSLISNQVQEMMKKTVEKILDRDYMRSKKLDLSLKDLQMKHQCIEKIDILRNMDAGNNQNDSKLESESDTLPLQDLLLTYEEIHKKLQSIYDDVITQHYNKISKGTRPSKSTKDDRENGDFDGAKVLEIEIIKTLIKIINREIRSDARRMMGKAGGLMEENKRSLIINPSNTPTTSASNIPPSTSLPSSNLTKAIVPKLNNENFQQSAQSSLSHFYTEQGLTRSITYPTSAESSGIPAPFVNLPYIENIMDELLKVNPSLSSSSCPVLNTCSSLKTVSLPYRFLDSRSDPGPAFDYYRGTLNNKEMRSTYQTFGPSTLISAEMTEQDCDRDSKLSMTNDRSKNNKIISTPQQSTNESRHISLNDNSRTSFNRRTRIKSAPIRIPSLRRVIYGANISHHSELRDSRSSVKYNSNLNHSYSRPSKAKTRRLFNIKSKFPLIMRMGLLKTKNRCKIVTLSTGNACYRRQKVYKHSLKSTTKEVVLPKNVKCDKHLNLNINPEKKMNSSPLVFDQKNEGESLRYLSPFYNHRGENFTRDNSNLSNHPSKNGIATLKEKNDGVAETPEISNSLLFSSSSSSPLKNQHRSPTSTINLSTKPQSIKELFFRRKSFLPSTTLSFGGGHKSSEFSNVIVPPTPSLSSIHKQRSCLSSSSLSLPTDSPPMSSSFDPGSLSSGPTYQNSSNAFIRKRDSLVGYNDMSGEYLELSPNSVAQPEINRFAMRRKRWEESSGLHFYDSTAASLDHSSNTPHHSLSYLNSFGSSPDETLNIESVNPTMVGSDNFQRKKHFLSKDKKLSEQEEHSDISHGLHEKFIKRIWRAGDQRGTDSKNYNRSKSTSSSACNPGSFSSFKLSRGFSLKGGLNLKTTQPTEDIRRENRINMSRSEEAVTETCAKGMEGGESKRKKIFGKKYASFTEKRNSVNESQERLGRSKSLRVCKRMTSRLLSLVHGWKNASLLSKSKSVDNASPFLELIAPNLANDKSVSDIAITNPSVPEIQTPPSHDLIRHKNGKGDTGGSPYERNSPLSDIPAKFGARNSMNKHPRDQSVLRSLSFRKHKVVFPPKRSRALLSMALRQNERRSWSRRNLQVPSSTGASNSGTGSGLAIAQPLDIPFPTLSSLNVEKSQKDEGQTSTDRVMNETSRNNDGEEWTSHTNVQTQGYHLKSNENDVMRADKTIINPDIGQDSEDMKPDYYSLNSVDDFGTKKDVYSSGIYSSQLPFGGSSICNDLFSYYAQQNDVSGRNTQQKSWFSEANATDDKLDVSMDIAIQSSTSNNDSIHPSVSAIKPASPPRLYCSPPTSPARPLHPPNPCPPLNTIDYRRESNEEDLVTHANESIEYVNSHLHFVNEAITRRNSSFSKSTLSLRSGFRSAHVSPLFHSSSSASSSSTCNPPSLLPTPLSLQPSPPPSSSSPSSFVATVATSPSSSSSSLFKDHSSSSNLKGPLSPRPPFSSPQITQQHTSSYSSSSSLMYGSDLSSFPSSFSSPFSSSTSSTTPLPLSTPSPTLSPPESSPQIHVTNLPTPLQRRKDSASIPAMAAFAKCSILKGHLDEEYVKIAENEILMDSINALLNAKTPSQPADAVLSNEKMAEETQTIKEREMKKNEEKIQEESKERGRYGSKVIDKANITSANNIYTNENSMSTDDQHVDENAANIHNSGTPQSLMRNISRSLKSVVANSNGGNEDSSNNVNNPRNNNNINTNHYKYHVDFQMNSLLYQSQNDPKNYPLSPLRFDERMSREDYILASEFSTSIVSNSENVDDSRNKNHDDISKEAKSNSTDNVNHGDKININIINDVNNLMEDVFIDSTSHRSKLLVTRPSSANHSLSSIRRVSTEHSFRTASSGSVQNFVDEAQEEIENEGGFVSNERRKNQNDRSSVEKQRSSINDNIVLYDVKANDIEKEKEQFNRQTSYSNYIELIHDKKIAHVNKDEKSINEDVSDLRSTNVNAYDLVNSEAWSDNSNKLNYPSITAVGSDLSASFFSPHRHFSSVGLLQRKRSIRHSQLNRANQVRRSTSSSFPFLSFVPLSKAKFAIRRLKSYPISNLLHLDLAVKQTKGEIMQKDTKATNNEGTRCLHSTGPRERAADNFITLSGNEDSKNADFRFKSLNITSNPISQHVEDEEEKRRFGIVKSKSFNTSEDIDHKSNTYHRLSVTKHSLSHQGPAKHILGKKDQHCYSTASLSKSNTSSAQNINRFPSIPSAFTYYSSLPFADDKESIDDTDSIKEPQFEGLIRQEHLENGSRFLRVGRKMRTRLIKPKSKLIQNIIKMCRKSKRGNKAMCNKEIKINESSGSVSCASSNSKRNKSYQSSSSDKKSLQDYEEETNNDSQDKGADLKNFDHVGDDYMVLQNNSSSASSEERKGIRNDSSKLATGYYGKGETILRGILPESKVEASNDERIIQRHPDEDEQNKSDFKSILAKVKVEVFDICKDEEMKNKLQAKGEAIMDFTRDLAVMELLSMAIIRSSSLNDKSPLYLHRKSKWHESEHYSEPILTTASYFKTLYHNRNKIMKSQSMPALLPLTLNRYDLSTKANKSVGGSTVYTMVDLQRERKQIISRLTPIRFNASHKSFGIATIDEESQTSTINKDLNSRQIINFNAMDSTKFPSLLLCLVISFTRLLLFTAKLSYHSTSSKELQDYLTDKWMTIRKSPLMPLTVDDPDVLDYFTLQNFCNIAFPHQESTKESLKDDPFIQGKSESTDYVAPIVPPNPKDELSLSTWQSSTENEMTRSSCSSLISLHSSNNTLNINKYTSTNEDDNSNSEIIKPSDSYTAALMPALVGSKLSLAINENKSFHYLTNDVLVPSCMHNGGFTNSENPQVPLQVEDKQTLYSYNNPSSTIPQWSSGNVLFSTSDKEESEGGNLKDKQDISSSLQHTELFFAGNEVAQEMNSQIKRASINPLPFEANVDKTQTFTLETITDPFLLSSTFSHAESGEFALSPNVAFKELQRGFHRSALDSGSSKTPVDPKHLCDSKTSQKSLPRVVQSLPYTVEKHLPSLQSEELLGSRVVHVSRNEARKFILNPIEEVKSASETEDNDDENENERETNELSCDESSMDRNNEYNTSSEYCGVLFDNSNNNFSHDRFDYSNDTNVSFDNVSKNGCSYNSYYDTNQNADSSSSNNSSINAGSSKGSSHTATGSSISFGFSDPILPPIDIIPSDSATDLVSTSGSQTSSFEDSESKTQSATAWAIPMRNRTTTKGRPEEEDKFNSAHGRVCMVRDKRISSSQRTLMDDVMRCVFEDEDKGEGMDDGMKGGMERGKQGKEEEKSYQGEGQVTSERDMSSQWRLKKDREKGILMFERKEGIETDSRKGQYRREITHPEVPSQAQSIAIPCYKAPLQSIDERQRFLGKDDVLHMLAPSEDVSNDLNDSCDESRENFTATYDNSDSYPVISMAITDSESDSLVIQDPSFKTTELKNMNPNRSSPTPSEMKANPLFEPIRFTTQPSNPNRVAELPVIQDPILQDINQKAMFQVPHRILPHFHSLPNPPPPPRRSSSVFSPLTAITILDSDNLRLDTIQHTHSWPIERDRFALQHFRLPNPTIVPLQRSGEESSDEQISRGTTESSEEAISINAWVDELKWLMSSEEPEKRVEEGESLQVNEFTPSCSKGGK